MKLLAVAERREKGFSFRVRPSFIGTDHPLAWVSGPFNAISVYGGTVGHTMYYGRGAGGQPTSSAIVADIVSIATGSYSSSFERLAIWSDRSPPAPQLPVEEVESRYYLRLTVDDKPGVLGRVSSHLGAHGISISSVLQKEPGEGPIDDTVPVVIMWTPTASSSSAGDKRERNCSLTFPAKLDECLATRHSARSPKPLWQSMLKPSPVHLSRRKPFRSTKSSG